MQTWRRRLANLAKILSQATGSLPTIDAMVARKSFEHIASSIVLTLTAAALMLGIWRHALWTHWPSAGAQDLLLALLAALLAAAVLRVCTRFTFTQAIAACFLLLLVGHIGFATLTATALLALSALALGQALCTGLNVGVALRMVIGLGLLLGALAWALPLPIHHRALYLPLLLAPIVWQRQALLVEFRQWLAQSPSIDLGARWSSAFAVLVIGLMALPAALPTSMVDDLAYHLGLPSELLRHGYYRLDAATTVWANAPWATDLAQGVVAVLAGSIDGRGALFGFWYLLALCLLWQLLSRHAVPLVARWLALALFASQPIHFQLAFGMQTEMATQTVLLALMLLIAEVDGQASARRLLAIAAVVGLALAIKVLNLVYLAPLAIWFFCRWRSLAWNRLLGPLVLMLIVGGASYAYSYAVSGNPLLPLLNQVFHSPFYPDQAFRDATYAAGIDPSLPWRLIFDTPRLHEGYVGAGGFQWLFVFAMLPFLLWHRASRVYALIGLGAVLLLWSQIQHLRYSVPAMLPLAIAAAIYARAVAWPMILLCVALTLANLAFAPNIFYQLRNGFAVDYLLKPDGAERFLADRRPERLLLKSLVAERRNFLLFQEGDIQSIAELGGRGITANWSDPQTWLAFHTSLADGSSAAYARFFSERGISHVMVSERSHRPAFLAALPEIAELDRVLGPIQLFRLRPQAAEFEHQPIDRGFRYRLDKPGTAPHFLTIELEVHCLQAQSDFLLLRYSFDEHDADGGAVLFDKQCRGQEILPLRTEIRVKSAFQRVNLQLANDVGPAQTWRLGEQHFSWRRDFMAERDFARQLRGRKP